MTAVSLNFKLEQSLLSDTNSAEIDADKNIFLTPNLVLVCAVLYMMASDGEIDAQESSQLQTVLGSNSEVFKYGLRYVQSVHLSQFLKDAPEVLSTRDKWCILTNVCDALLSDGRMEEAELKMFEQMVVSFGLTSEQFEPYFKLLRLKNDKGVLGSYSLKYSNNTPEITPHFALAVSLLYMLTADGSIGTEEIGQLEAVIGEFEGLQAAALKYVRSTKLKPFLKLVVPLLSVEQKLYILTNVCDSMMADGNVAALEDKVFVTILTAFEFNEASFANYFQVLEVKNVKPFDTSTFKNVTSHSRAFKGEDEEGIQFENDLSSAANESFSLAGIDPPAGQGSWNLSSTSKSMGAQISRTMQDNIQSVSDDFGSQDNVVKVAQNATDDLNLQKINNDAQALNRQTIAQDDVSANRQVIKQHGEDLNRQAIAQDSVDSNRQKVTDTNVALNRQTIEGQITPSNRLAICLEGLDPNRQQIDVETRAQNIHAITDHVREKLDRFEVQNYDFLQVGRKARFNDSFAAIEMESAQGVNRQLVNESIARNEVIFPTPDAIDASSQTQSLLEHSESLESISRSSQLTINASDVGHPADIRVSLALRTAIKRGGIGFGLIKAVVASATIAFASPIDVKVLMGRVAAGPLITLPVAVDGGDSKQEPVREVAAY